MFAVIGPDDPRHGTPNGYSNLKCHCERCSEAMRDYRRSRAIYRTRLQPNDARHGTLNGYTNHLCRCPRCRRAFSVYIAERRSLRKS